MVGIYWSTGITVTAQGDTWSAEVEFYDNGHCDLRSTRGCIRTSYVMDSLEQAIDLVKADAESLGIKWSPSPFLAEELVPFLYYIGDGEDEEYPPPQGMIEVLVEQAGRLGWQTYDPEVWNRCVS